MYHNSFRVRLFNVILWNCCLNLKVSEYFWKYWLNLGDVLVTEEIQERNNKNWTPTSKALSQDGVRSQHWKMKEKLSLGEIFSTMEIQERNNKNWNPASKASSPSDGVLKHKRRMERKSNGANFENPQRSIIKLNKIIYFITKICFNNRLIINFL